MVWVFGEAFGGIFAPGATWLFGTPGAVLFYGVAGILLALPERSFATQRLGRIVLALGGLFLIGMAVLQAWPGRGFWQGRGGTLTAMVGEMSTTSQPRFLSSLVASFGSFNAAHGWAVNLFVVVALAVIGALLLTGRRPLALGALIGLGVLCVADWVLVEDLGFFGGVGTDPNSMLPMALLYVGGYVAAFRVPLTTTTATAPTAGQGALADAVPWWQRATPAYITRSAAVVAAVGVVAIGTAPMALAAVNQNADPILTEALDGTPNTLDTPAPSFALTDQHGHAVSLASLRGHTIALTFLDPVCTSDCPLIAQEFRQADQQLAGQARQVDFVAIVANPIYRSAAFTNAFDRQEGLTHLVNWYFLTGSVPQLQRVWDSYGVLVNTVAAGAMVAHSDLAFVIDPQGRERDALIDDPGPTQTYASSFSSLLLSRIDDVTGS
jgi:cytochrome oxidase Cu insertion factor (SCO1/SenC/PrrC family)